MISAQRPASNGLERALLRVLFGLLLPTIACQRSAPDGSASARAARSHEALSSTASPPDSSREREQDSKPGAIGHVFLLVLENEGAETTFGIGKDAPYLSKTLVDQGALLSNYYGIAHYSLGNYIAMISGQGPTADTQQDCVIFRDFVGAPPDPARDGQAVGRGCVYPKSVVTLSDQLERLSPQPLSWKGYMQDMGKDPRREPSRCGHPPIDARDNTQEATAHDQYATRHDPFVYFHSIIDDQPRCDAHVVELDELATDLTDVASSPSFSMIVPNLCDDGHDTGCANGGKGGFVSIDAFLRRWVPRILSSPAYTKDGLLVITFDEAETVDSDSRACCGETSTPNVEKPGIKGPGGGVVGAVLLSRFIAPGTRSVTPYNHYSLLKTLETIFGLPYLGYALFPYEHDVMGTA